MRSQLELMGVLAILSRPARQWRARLALYERIVISVKLLKTITSGNSADQVNSVLCARQQVESRM